MLRRRLKIDIAGHEDALPGPRTEVHLQTTRLTTDSHIRAPILGGMTNVTHHVMVLLLVSSDTSTEPEEEFWAGTRGCVG